MALSSRNGYLSGDQRRSATTIYQTLQALATQLKQGVLDCATLCEQGAAQLAAAGFVVDYVEIRTPLLGLPDAQSTEWVILIAAKLGKTRLIDNLSVVVD